MALRFAPHLDVVCIEDHGIVATGEAGCELYGGRLFARIGSLADGSRGRDEIAAACGEDGDRVAADAAIVQLLRNGVLVEQAAGPASDPDAAWWSSQGVAPELAAARIRAGVVDVQALDGVDPAATIAALHSAGLQIASEAAVTIVVTEDYLDDRLRELNLGALREGRRWLLAQPQAAQVLIGPLFTPQQGPCWQCLAHRVQRLRRVERGVPQLLTGGPRERAHVGTPASLRLLGPALVATELARWLAGARPGFESLILSFDPRTWKSAEHQVVWRPQCRACGEHEASVHQEAQPIRFAGREPTGGPEASLRTVSPGVTLKRFMHHVNPVSGAVATLTKLPGPDHAHVYIAGGPIAHVYGDERPWRETVGIQWQGLLGTYAAGKGTSDEAAQTSALCEALERFSGGFGGEEPRRRASLNQLGDLALDPNDDMGFSIEQYAQRTRLNNEFPSFRMRVPEAFEADQQIDWTPAWSLTHQQERLVPTALCYTGAYVPGRPFCVADSNGNSAGNTLEEAILHGLLERIERDHVALWWYNRRPAPGIDLDSLEDPWLAQLRTFAAASRQRLWALDLTADLGIPVAGALTTWGEGSRIGVGFGAHVDMERAVVRAATELVQFGLGDPSVGARTRSDQPMRLDRHSFVGPDPETPLRSPAAGSDFSGDVLGALEMCQAAIERAGIELLVVDQTRPDIGLPVVRVLTPGLRHWWPRFAPGRLYDVPVTLGWRDRACREDELDPTPVP